MAMFRDRSNLEIWIALLAACQLIVLIHTQKCQKNQNQNNESSYFCKEIKNVSELITELGGSGSGSDSGSIEAAKGLAIYNEECGGLKLEFGSSNGELHADAAGFMAHLEKLDLSKACMFEFSGYESGGLSRFVALQQLNISNNRLEQLEPKHFPIASQIENLDASFNNLESLSLKLMQRFPALRYANFSRNALKSIENGTFAEMERLEYLNLDSNELENVQFGYIPNLRQLIMSNNLIQKLTFASDFTIIPKLQSLQLAANYLKRIEPGVFQEFAQLRLLNVSANKLETLMPDTFLGLGRLLTLDLSLNDMQKLAASLFHPMPKLQVLDLSGNSLEKLESPLLNGLTSVRKLFLQNNNIENIGENTFAGLIALDTLDLSNNALTYLGADIFGGMAILPKMRKLMLKANNLKQLHPLAFASLPYLNYLSLGQNELISLDVRMFAPLRRLDKLHLGNNQLEEISIETLEAINGISELLIDNNKLTFLHQTNATTFPNLRKVAIEGNPWQCACLEDLTGWLNFKQIEYVRKQSPYYKGERPMCRLTLVEYCVKDLRIVKRYKLVDMFEQDAGNTINEEEETKKMK